MQRPVQLAVPAPIEPMPHDPAGGGRDRSDAGQHGEGGLEHFGVTRVTSAEIYVAAVAVPSG